MHVIKNDTSVKVPFTNQVLVDAELFQELYDSHKEVCKVLAYIDGQRLRNGETGKNYFGFVINSIKIGGLLEYV